MSTPAAVDDYEDQAVAWRLGCDEGDATACYSLGEYYAMVKDDKVRAAAIFRENCRERSNGNSCFSLALMSLRGHGGQEKSAKEALRLAERACSVGHAQGCETAAQMHSVGKAGPRNKREAVRLREVGCSLKHAPSCYHLGAAYLTGNRGAQRDLGKALTAMKTACEEGYGAACHNVAVFYENGHGVAKDPEKAAFYRKETERVKEERMREMGVA
jgi:TPR repeat protein